METVLIVLISGMGLACLGIVIHLVVSGIVESLAARRQMNALNANTRRLIDSL